MSDEIAEVLAGERQWCVVHGNCREVMASMPDASVDHVITDPPYSEQVHKSVRGGGRHRLHNAATAPRVVDLGFEHLDDATRLACAIQFARLVKRWILAFSDVESAHLWQRDLVDAGLRYRRTGAWLRIGGAPQFSGDGPAAGFEAIAMAHRPGRSRWNGGGHAAVYTHPIVANRIGQRGSRCHTAQKPLALMLELVELFADPGDIILDPFAGSGTTLVAAMRLGRRAIGIELDAAHCATARERCEAEADGSTLQARRAGQVPMFGGSRGHEDAGNE